ncbi:hypothetical protein D3C76_1502970 [compost metagenome]
MVMWVINRVTATSCQADKPSKPSYHIGYRALDKEKTAGALSLRTQIKPVALSDKSGWMFL